MITKTLAAVVFAITLAGGGMAAPLGGDQTYDMLFRNGTLDDVNRDTALVYRRVVVNALNPEAGTRDTGHVALSFRKGDPSMAILEFQQDGKHRVMGTFPANVGNPMIMYFYEAAVRDMAESAGGSPFYIRNRVKEALINPSDIEVGEAQFEGRVVKTQTIRLYPFAGDKNQNRMKGFGDLELRVTMSEEVPGWYLSLVAEAAGGDVYRSELSFDHLEDTK
ncbi:hypothetical protein SAMN04488040_1893 [Sulfitobacter marinus]|uniref:Uncharacterized protein n=1 Tax=Sulfitobacter marinus TaxID=394264 RepID=A0A1I6SVP3_9RHOB|nr:hypothetical protein [Sulfitobacter marinus]SFS80923.1 hypothetical protein SAMN04488040_1893 [Sulfitobacter marinus]